MIQVCQRKMERKITHVTLRDRVRCEDLRRSKKKHRHERRFQPSRDLNGNGAATSRGWTTTDGHTSSPCGTPEKAEGTWDDNGRDGLTNSKDLRATNGPEVRKTESVVKRT